MNTPQYITEILLKKAKKELAYIEIRFSFTLKYDILKISLEEFL